MLLRGHCSVLLYNRRRTVVVKLESPSAWNSRPPKSKTTPFFVMTMASGKAISTEQLPTTPKQSATTATTTATATATAKQSTMVGPAPLTDLGKQLTVRRTPELGLFSLFFVLSTAIGAVLSLALLSIPSMSACRRLARSMEKLVQVVSSEVPGTLFSLKLSSLEINDLIQQLSNLRQKTSRNQYGKKNRNHY